MADSPWTITSTKRRKTTTAAASRKRLRLSNDVSTPSAKTSGRRNIGQQTLTQIDFVKSSSFESEHGLDQAMLEPVGQAKVPPQVQSARRRLKKESTLTQMDFFDPLTAETTDIFDDRAIGKPKLKARGAQKRPPIPAFDGAHDDQPERHDGMPQPRSRPEKLAHTSEVVKKAERVKSLEDKDDHEGHRHRKRRKVHIDESIPGPVNKRRSGRLAAANVNEPTPNSCRGHPGSQLTSGQHRTHNDLAGRPVLEVQDSTDFTEPSLDPTSKLAIMMAQPVTPIKKRDRIPSSQTPESLSRTRLTRSIKRQALAELSTNIQRTPSKVAKTSKVLAKSPQKQSPCRKICVLKVPTRALLPRSKRVEDSQQDVWSLQATSSPRRDKESSQTEEEQVQRTITRDKSNTSTQLSKHQSDSPSIQESTPRDEVDTQKLLPDVSAIFGLPDDVNLSTAHGPLVDPQLDVRMSAHGAHGEVPADQEPINMIPELEEVSSDGLSDFGSPVANDTQFAKSLRNRVSSPIPISDDDKHGARTAPAKGHQISPPPRGLARISMAMSPPRRSPLPAPRLVGTSPFRNVQRQAADSSTESLPLNAIKRLSPNKAGDSVKITKVPLNDTNDDQGLSSSSSPALPPQIPTQKSVHPASIPHPSQISTQAPSTQGFNFPVSSAPYSFPVPHDSEIERITIKDSSSVSGRLSQFQQYTQGQELDAEDEIRLVEDFEDSENDGDLDLDPSTWRAPSPSKSIRHQARIAQQTIEEEDVTQTPTQELRARSSLIRRVTNDQSSPIVTNATTRSQRDANLEVIALPSSSQPTSEQCEERCLTPRPANNIPISTTTETRDFAGDQHNQQSPPSSSLSSSLFSPSPPRRLQRKYSPIPGFDNDTQSDFTQDGHVTAAYVHRMREEGLLPQTYVPKPFKPKNWSKSTRSERRKERATVRESR